jgi:hypothetical protein
MISCGKLAVDADTGERQRKAPSPVCHFWRHFPAEPSGRVINTNEASSPPCRAATTASRVHKRQRRHQSPAEQAATDTLGRQRPRQSIQRECAYSVRVGHVFRCAGCTSTVLRCPLLCSVRVYRKKSKLARLDALENEERVKP